MSGTCVLMRRGGTLKLGAVLHEQQTYAEQQSAPGQKDCTPQDTALVLRVPALEEMNHVQHTASLAELGRQSFGLWRTVP